MVKKERVNVILVDDEKDMFFLFKIKFKKEIKKEEIKFNFFSSGLDALKFLELSKNEGFDYIISDLSMPDINGLDLLRKIKEKDANQKVFVISGHGHEEMVEKAKLLGVDGYLQKPVNFVELKKMIL